MTPFNKTIISGRFVADPELKQLPSGKAVAKFTIAVRRNYKNQQGDYDSDFVPCQVFGKLAETVSKYFAKGSEILVEGAFTNNNYTDKNGAKHYEAVINVASIVFGEKNKNSPIARGEEVRPAMPSGGGGVMSDFDPNEFEKISEEEGSPF